MNLIIDVGNTFVKYAVFKAGNIVYQNSSDIGAFSQSLKEIKENFPLIKKSILSSVGQFNEGSLIQLQSNYSLLILNHETKLPFKNNYSTPKTLGADRLALITAAIKFHSNSNVLVIDAGTCVTYDFVDKDQNYLGGAISPGLSLRYKSLNNYTANLPLLEKEIPRNITGNTTVDSIHSGVVNGLVLEIDGAIEKYKKQYSDLTVILTGGDCYFLSNQLKNSIFANSNFLLEGLNHILEYNSH